LTRPRDGGGQLAHPERALLAVVVGRCTMTPEMEKLKMNMILKGKYRV
jgi:hypothetical protein